MHQNQRDAILRLSGDTQRPHSVHDGDDSHAYIAEHGHPHVGNPEEGERQNHDGHFYPDGKHDVLPHDAHGLA